MFCDNWYLTGAYHSGTDLLHLLPVPLMISWVGVIPILLIQRKSKPITCLRTHYGPICMKQTKQNRGNLNLEISCLVLPVSPKRNILSLKRMGKFMEWLGRLRREEWEDWGGTMEAGLVPLWMVSKFAFRHSHPPLTQRIFWDLLNFNRVWLIGALGSSLSDYCGECSWQSLNLCLPLLPWL